MRYLNIVYDMNKPPVKGQKRKEEHLILREIATGKRSSRRKDSE